MDNCPRIQKISRRSLRLSKLFLGISLSALAILLSDCKNKSGLTESGDSPVIMATNPANNAEDVAVNSNITAVFNDEMNPSTITVTTFTLRNDTNAVNGTIHYSDSIATFTPSGNLSFGGVYTATITTGVENLDGVTIENNYEWSFTTEEGVSDTTSPQVVSTNPANNAENVSVNTEITATFNEAMNASTLNTTTFTVSQDGSSISGSVSYDGTTATFAPTNPLSFDINYTANITTGAQDTTGNALANSVTWNFTTEAEPDKVAPEITSTTPANDADDVAVTTNISVTFSEQMNQASVEDAFTVSQNGNNVAGAVTFDGNTATFNPNNNLNFDTGITATISTGAKDLAGNALANNFSWSFTTSEEPDKTAPEITSTEPGDDAKDISVNTNISATFSEAMDEASVEDAFVVLQNGTAVTGAIAVSNNTATFNPTDNLNFDTKVTATISTAAQDLAGNALQNNFSWSFTTGKEPDETAPEITSITPADNAVDVSIATNITAEFSEAVNSETINTTNFTVSQEGSNVAGAFNINGAEVTFNPTNNLSPDTEVNVKITTGVQDMAGNNLEGNFTSSFTTEQESVPPIIDLNTPEDGATNVPVNTDITATFNEAMDPASVRDAFTVSQNGTTVAGTITFDGNTATFNPTNNLNFASTITATISTDAQDLVGNNLESEYSWSFTTEQETVPPVVESTNPGNGAVDVSVESNITATFNEAMDPASINKNTFIVSRNGTQIAGGVTYSNGTATFNPTNDLETGATYGATITTGTQDVAGNALENNYNWSFTTEQESIPPVVNSTTPDDGDTNVPVNSNITATFSEAMDEESVQGAFTVTQNGEDVAGTVSFSGNTAIFNPANNLNFNTSITAAISTSAKDLAGNNLENNFSWNFTTEQESIPPEVSSTDPTDGETDVPVNSNISATFNEEMDPATIDETTFTVSQGGAAVGGEVSYSGNTATFNPTNDMEFVTDYTATITTGVEDLAGNSLQSNYTWNFNTEQESTPPEVSSTDPADGETDVPVNSNISATFNEEMDPATIDETTFTVSQGGAAVGGEVSYSGNTATFNPTNDMEFVTDYTATITTGVEDLAGNNLQSNYTWNFNTEQETTPPEVSSTDPTDGETDVPVSSNISATFNEEMDPATINETTFTVSQGGAAVGGEVSYSGNTATFNPTNDMEFVTDYTATITTGVQDLAGNALLNDFEWSFTTKSSHPDLD